MWEKATNKKFLLGAALLLGAAFLFLRYFHDSSVTSDKDSLLGGPSKSVGGLKEDSKASELLPAKDEVATELDRDLGNLNPPVGADANSSMARWNFSDKERKSWEAYLDIVQSKNDNDPRLDGDLKNLSDKVRAALKGEYQKIKNEKRNERGLVVFLLSRDIKSEADLNFLKSVYEEAPCLSLQNCAAASSDVDPHHSEVDQATMNYPQMVALYQIEKKMNDKSPLFEDPAMRAQLRILLQQAARFKVPSIQKKADELLSRL